MRATLLNVALLHLFFITAIIDSAVSSAQTKHCFQSDTACLDELPIFRDSKPCKSLCSERAAAIGQTSGAHECGTQRQCCCYFNPVAAEGPNARRANNADPGDDEHVDLVKNLPGLEHEINFRTFAGYLNGDERGTRRMFYWLMESQLEPSVDPLVFWFNGGPGCSSMEGALTEIGPFHVNKSGSTLVRNPWAWNQMSNLVFIDQPAGTGFSYRKDGYWWLSVSDQETGRVNLHVLTEFFARHPRFADRDFFIVGESYAGVYIPVLATQIVQAIDQGTFANVNFKGIGIGNGALDSETMVSSLVPFLFYHGVLSFDDYEAVNAACCKDGEELSAGVCNYARHIVPSVAANYDSDGSKCGDLVMKITYDVSFEDIQNIYSMYQACYSPPRARAEWGPMSRNLVSQLKEDGKFRDDTVSAGSEHGFGCYAEDAYQTYLSRLAVQQALHIEAGWRRFTGGTFEMCSDPVFYHYKQTVFNVAPILQELVSQDKVPLRVLIYGGDVDTVCNFVGTSLIVHKLADALGLKLEKPHREWYFEGSQAGFVEKFSDRLSFITVHGAGHMVPTDRPGPALQMITNWVLDKDVGAQLYRRPKH